jgi:hypothetical protein
MTDDISMVQFLKAMSAAQLGTLAFNLGGLAWIGLNIKFGPCFWPHYEPCAYLTPGLLTAVFLTVLVFASALSFVAIKRGSILPAFLTVTFMWALLASIVRELTL